MRRYYDKEEKMEIIKEIIKNLKEFPKKNGGKMNLYEERYSYVEKFKRIACKWIKEEKSGYEGELYFEELDKYFEYKLPKMEEEKYKFELKRNKYLK